MVTTATGPQYPAGDVNIGALLTLKSVTKSLLAMEHNTANEKNSVAIIHVYAAKGISRVTTVDFTTASVTKVSTVVLGYYYCPLLAKELNTANEKNSAAIIHVYATKGISRFTTVDFTTARVTKVSTFVLGYYYCPLSLMLPRGPRCIAVLQSNRLCGELDRMIMKLRTFILVREPSPIVISKGTSLRGQECSPEKPTSRTLIGVVPMVFIKIAILGHVMGSSAPDHARWLFEVSLVVIWGAVCCDLFCFNPSVSLLHQTLVTSWETQKLQSIICVPSNESSSAFSFLLLDVMQCEMCLRKLPLLAKMGSKLCLQVFVVENATCLLTISQYSGGIFKRVGEHVTGHGHCPFLHTNGTFKEVEGTPKEELPPEPGKDGSWVAHRYERLSITREMRTVRREIPSYVSRRMTAFVHGGQRQL
ncbi:hypothetical protein Tco_0937029 [Tanacetum coccineum]|uniref:Uncharacterized protein n=1 Tax=Tanacetum coccineum TaxID=301880 RepID=A0ABQ5DK28_9ASTR